MCRAGPMPTPDVEIEEGDRIFAIGLTPLTEEIRATSNISQRLAEAFHRNSAPKTFRDSVPDHLQDFEDVFAKESFDALPEKKVWDHAIELVPDAKHSNCKIYPLSVAEQTQLDAFIEENITSGRIRPSKSPMASPCFFIKKNDGSLRFIQDYRALNAIRTLSSDTHLPFSEHLKMGHRASL